MPYDFSFTAIIRMNFQIVFKCRS